MTQVKPDHGIKCRTMIMQNGKIIERKTG